MKNKKILIVAESIDVENSSGAKGRVALIKNLQEIGYKIRVYHYSKKEIQLENIECFRIKENRRSLLFLLSRTERRLRLSYNIHLNAIIDSLFGFSFTLYNDRNSIVRGLKSIRNYDFDLVITLSMGGSFRPHHALLQIPQWYDRWMAFIHDPYPMHSYPRPYDWVEPGHQQKRKFFLKVSEKAKFATYPSKLLAEWMETYFHSLVGKRIVIPHQITFDKINKEPEGILKENGFNIVHAGTLLSARNPMPLIAAFEKFLDEMPEAQRMSRLIFLGPKSSYSSELQKIKKKLPQLYVSESSLPFNDVLALQFSASVNIILEAKGPISPFLPGKFPHCIAARKPILLLGPYYSESKRLLGEGYENWAEIDDLERIKELIRGFYIQWKFNPSSLKFESEELLDYLSTEHLKKVMNNIFLAGGYGLDDSKTEEI